MKKTTEILMLEHKNILKVIDALIKECGSLENGKQADKAFFENAIDFIRNYADKFHHAKEEDILFFELCKDSVHLHCNPVEQMLYEHELGRKFVQAMQEGVDKSDNDKIIEGALGYCRLLQEHIFKEDNILYPMADDVLDEKIQESMLARFEKAEKRVFDKGTHEKYLSLVKDLTA